MSNKWTLFSCMFCT